MRFKNFTCHPIYLEINGKEYYLPSEGWVTVPPKARVLEKSRFSPVPVWQTKSPTKDITIPPISDGEIGIVSQEVLEYAQISDGLANRLWRTRKLMAPGLKEIHGAKINGDKVIVTALIHST